MPVSAAVRRPLVSAPRRAPPSVLRRAPPSDVRWAPAPAGRPPPRYSTSVAVAKAVTSKPE
ncbi:hypothetical protein AB0912_28755, partial [Streptomyces sp. NPDC007084]|uniref:hypothetical protein n=1 Tax=Streptomyces sp. NPDC007084 TaxID=3154313 RepID=UPI00345237F0